MTVRGVHDELVFAMPPVSTAMLERLGDAVLGDIAPHMIERGPAALDVLHLVDHVLPRFNIHVGPADPAQLGDNEALTDPSGDDEIDILLRDDHWQHLLDGGRRGHRPRATVMHEVSHAILHVPVIRRRRASPLLTHTLERVWS